MIILTLTVIKTLALQSLFTKHTVPFSEMPQLCILLCEWQRIVSKLMGNIVWYHLLTGEYWIQFVHPSAFENIVCFLVWQSMHWYLLKPLITGKNYIKPVPPNNFNWHSTLRLIEPKTKCLISVPSASLIKAIWRHNLNIFFSKLVTLFWGNNETQLQGGICVILFGWSN